MHITPTHIVGAFSALLLAAAAFVVTGPPAAASEPTVGLGTAQTFVVLAGSTVTNTGPSSIGGDLGVSPGTAVTGFPPGLVTQGSIHSADDEAAAARAALLTAWSDAAGRTSTGTISANLAGQRLVGGVYASGALALDGTVTLDAENVADTVWVFQAASTLITGSNSRVVLVNGADPCNVFWQVGSSATIGTGTTFVGTVMALTSVTANTGATVEGRLLAHDGAVTLDDNVIRRPGCAAVPTTTTVTVPDVTTSSTVVPEVTTSTSVTVPDVTTSSTVVPDVTTSTTVPDATTSTVVPDVDATTSTTALAAVTTFPSSTTVVSDATPSTTAGEGAVVTPTSLAETTRSTVPTQRETTSPPGPVPSIAEPANPATPTTPTTVGTRTFAAPPATGTPTPPTRLPRTGGATDLAAALGGTALLLGAVLVCLSRRTAAR